MHIRRKLGKGGSSRKMMVSGITSSLVLHEQIKTTLPKAKEVIRLFDRSVAVSRKGTLHARRRMVSLLRNPDAEKKMFDDICRRNMERKSGHVRCFRLGSRRGDGAMLVLLRLCDSKRNFTEEIEKFEAAREKEEDVQNVSETASEGTSEEKQVSEEVVEKDTETKKS